MGIYENMQNEPVSRLALREPITVLPSDSVRQAVERMREGKLGCVIAVDEQHKPVGMFTESMLTQLLAQNPSAVDDPLANHMSSRWPWVALTDKIAVVLEAMQTKSDCEVAKSLK